MTVSLQLHQEDEIELVETLLREGEHVVSVETHEVSPNGWDTVAVCAEGCTHALCRWMPTADPLMVEHHRRLVYTWLWARL